MIGFRADGTRVEIEVRPVESPPGAVGKIFFFDEREHKCFTALIFGEAFAAASELSFLRSLGIERVES